MRTGPRPLAVHVGMAAAIWGGGSAAAACLSPGQNFCLGSVKNCLAVHTEATERLSKMLRGIRAYQDHPYVRTLPALPIAWTQGESRLLYAQAKAGRRRKNAPVLLVPSLINGATILDLLQERSFLRWLAARGFEAYLLDWGALTRDACLATLDGAIGTRLVGALQQIASRHSQRVHLIGYCMGGMLTLGAARLAPDRVRSVTLLATPWDFVQGPQPLGDRIKASAPQAWAVIDSLGYLPVDWIQALFASVDPLMVARKFSRFAEMDPASDKARLFVAAEDWLNNGLDLPADVARACLKGWYIDNEPARGLWRLGGQPVRAENLTVPALVVASRRDRLVPFESAASIASHLPRATLLEPACGHIGMMAGEASPETIWSPVARWLGRLA